MWHNVFYFHFFTHICRSRDFKGALQELGPELSEGLVQVESGAPVVLSQVGVEICVETRVLGVQGAEWRQHLLQGALRAAVQLSEVGWRRREEREGQRKDRRRREIRRGEENNNNRDEERGCFFTVFIGFICSVYLTVVGQAFTLFNSVFGFTNSYTW